MGKIPYSVVEDAPQTSLCSDAIQKFFIALILIRVFGRDFLPHLELTANDNITIVVFFSFHDRCRIFMHYQLRHLKQNIFAFCLGPSFEKVQILEK